MKNKVLRHFRLLPLTFFERETSFPGKQQLYVLVYYIAAIIVEFGTNLIGVSCPLEDFNIWLNSGYILAIVLFLTGYIYRKIPLSFTLSGLIMTTQIVTSAEMLYCAFTPDDYRLILIVGNTVLLAVNILFSLMACLKCISYILCGTSIGTYIACMLITGNGSLGYFLGVFLVIFIAVCISGCRQVKRINSPNEEGASLNKDETELLDMLGLEKEQVVAYIELAQGKHNFDRTELLLDMMGEKLQRNVIANVKEFLSVQEIGVLEMETLFPELSISEREVCRLILQEKKLSEICAILDKKESNINSTRAHIRRKLNMQPSNNLCKVLQQRVEKGQKRIPE